jgi:hypothetical protein
MVVVPVQWLDFPSGVSSLAHLQQVILLRATAALRRREPRSLVYGSREAKPSVWRRGPRLSIEVASPSSITGDRIFRVYKGPPEMDIAVDEDVFNLANLTVIRVFGVWGAPDP